MSRALVDYYEAVCKALPASDPTARKLAANWVLGEFSAARNRDDIEIASSPVAPAQLAALLRRIGDHTLSGKMAKDVFDALWRGEATGDAAADAIIERRGLRQISDTAAIEALVRQVIAGNPTIVAEFRAGREKAFNSLVGQVMKASKGKANPARVNALLRRELGP
jgi:aspartyl-tRNA(Asn)/glutamyl-tRNA(Gln) amidotransferase subunit B